jgi:hypothetical protein
VDEKRRHPLFRQGARTAGALGTLRTSTERVQLCNTLRFKTCIDGTIMCHLFFHTHTHTHTHTFTQTHSHIHTPATVSVRHVGPRFGAPGHERPSGGPQKPPIPAIDRSFSYVTCGASRRVPTPSQDPTLVRSLLHAHSRACTRIFMTTPGTGEERHKTRGESRSGRDPECKLPWAQARPAGQESLP